MNAGAPRVFLIGFNRTATRSLTALFSRAGLACTHWGGRDRATNVAYQMVANISLGRPILEGFEQVQVFSDLTHCEADCYIEGVRFFVDLHRANPDAYFILNTRDREDWIASRFAFGGGSFAQRAGSALGLSQDALAQAWRQLHDRHDAEVTAYFATRGERFLRFDIDRSPIGALSATLAPEVLIDETLWRRPNPGSP